MQTDLTKEQAEELQTWEEPLPVPLKKGQSELALDVESTVYQVECDCPQLPHVLDRIRRLGHQVLSMSVKNNATYVLSVSRAG